MKLTNTRSSFPREIFNFKSYTSKAENYSTSLQKVTDLGEPKSISNPFFHLLPEIKNPNNIVNLICSALKLKDVVNSPLPLLQKSMREQGLINHLGTQEISRVLLRCQSDANSALTFFNWVKSDVGLKLNTQNYCFVVHILVWSREFPQAMSILSELVDMNRGMGKNVDIFKSLLLCSNECNWDPVVFDMLIKAHLKFGMLKESYRAFRKMVKLGFVPQVITINCLLNGLSKSKYSSKCWEVYKEIGRIGVHPNPCTFNILTCVVCKDGDVDKVNEFLEKMEEEGFDPDIFTYNMLVHSYCRKGRLKDAIYLYHIMFRRGIEPDVVTCTVLINGLCKQGSVRDAHQIFAEMIQRGLRPDLMAFNTLISGYCKEGLMHEARSLLHDMIGSGLHPDNFTCKILVEGYHKQNHLISAVNLVVELQRFGFPIPQDVYDYLIIALSEEKRPFAAKRLLEGIRCHYEPSAEMYYSLIDSFCQCNYVEEGLLYKAEMESKDMKLNLGIYRTLICSLCRLSRMKEAENFIREMVQSGIDPDTDICRSLVTGYCKERNIFEAESILRLFALEFQVFDAISYNELSRVICKEYGVAKLMEFQDDLKEVGFVPNGQTCKYAVDGLKKVMLINKGIITVD